MDLPTPQFSTHFQTKTFYFFAGLVFDCYALYETLNVNKSMEEFFREKRYGVADKTWRKRLRIGEPA